MDGNLPPNNPPLVEMKEISDKMCGMSVEDKILDSAGDHNCPIVLIVVGMAGSGKTTLTQRLTAECLRRKSPPYIVNLDPACNDPPYPVNIDIRDTVNYKNVMKVYNLGPNGAIVTSLNLFATKFDQVLGLIEAKKKTHQYVIIDTPGQIEVFMWSASGSIITESLAALFPTVLVYVTDLVTNQNPITFMSNMTYACSILYKAKLPLVVILNKCDQVDATYAKKWITDYTSYQEALSERTDYASNLASSLALSMEEFYNEIAYAVVSAVDGYGMDEFFFAIQKSVADYEAVYKPMYEKVKQEKLLAEQEKKSVNMKKLKKDLKSSSTEPCFAVAGRDAGQGLALKLNDAEDETSSEEENPADENEERFGQMFNPKLNKENRGAPSK